MRLSYLRCLTFLVALTPHPLSAQFDVINKALEKIETVSVYYLYGGFKPPSEDLTTSRELDYTKQTGLQGFGFEVAIQVASIPGKAVPTAKCDTRWRDIPLTRKVIIDTIAITTTTKKENGNETTTREVKTTEIPRPKCREDAITFSIGLGYSQMSGFNGGSDSLDIRGALRTLPALAFYAAFNAERSVSPYLGFSVSLEQLHSLRAYRLSPTLDSATTTAFKGSGSTFGASLAGGVVVDLRRINLFLEPSYTVRYFPSIEWEADKNGTLPLNLPRRLRMSGWQIAVGLQVPLDLGDE